MTEVSVQQEIIRLEQGRCRALVDADIESLGKLVSDDVVHVHANAIAFFGTLAAVLVSGLMGLAIVDRHIPV